MKACKLNQVHFECGTDTHCYTLIQFAKEMEDLSLKINCGNSGWFWKYILILYALLVYALISHIQLIDCLLTQLCNTPTALQHLSAFRDIDTDPLEFSQITTVFAENCPKRENIQQRAVSTVTVPPSCQRSEEKDQSAFR